MSARRTKFYLDKKNGKFMGVCSGIADYTGIDVVWVRVAMVLSFFIVGWTLLGWILLTLAILDWRHFWLPDALTMPLAGKL